MSIRHFPMGVFALTVLISAFLLFQVQPLFARFILPWFGGGSGVWATCLFFFQALLVVGYAYAHLTSRFLRPRAQAILHVSLLLTAMLTLPFLPAPHWKPDSANAPALRILLILTVHLGLPYTALAATGPLLQVWFARLYPDGAPYRLYALSNVGSLLALLTYPSVFEPLLTRRTQAVVWAWGFGIFALLCALCAWRALRATPSSPGRSPTEPALAATATPPGASVRLLWFALPACGCVLLMAITNTLCQDVSSVPFLWVLPLSLYLVSFALCFDRPAWYARRSFGLLLVPALTLLGYALFRRNALPIPAQIGIYGGALFVGCMVCHGELYRLKPDPRFLTLFYLSISGGGATGGAFVALVAPLVFRSYAELGCGFWLLMVLLCWIHAREKSIWPILGRQWLLWPLILGGVAAVGGALLVYHHLSSRHTVAVARNFYGVLRVVEREPDDPEYHAYQLIHGNINHGLQFIDPVKATQPTTYFNEPSGVGLALDFFSDRTNRHIGVVGLGTGTLAAYGRGGDRFRFYEINPQVLRLAEAPFRYLKLSKAGITVVLGDARLSLEREPAQDFDVLVLDAFSSEAIPVHLLTQEAFTTYLRHLKPGGVLAVHISNKHVDLFPVLLGCAEFLHMGMVYIPWGEKPMPWGFCASNWILMTRSREFLYAPAIHARARRPARASATKPLFWTDEYASLFPIVQW